MAARLYPVRSLFPRLLLLGASAAIAQNAPSTPQALPPAQALALQQRALASELRNARDIGHPMRYRLRKSSPRLASSKEIVETRDGDVARLVSLFDKPLSPDDEQKEQARLGALLSDPGRQQHRKQGEERDTAIVLKLLRLLPQAFLYEYAGVSGNLTRFTFRPNPAFSPPDFETKALTAMTGELSIDIPRERVARL